MSLYVNVFYKIKLFIIIIVIISLYQRKSKQKPHGKQKNPMGYI